MKMMAIVIGILSFIMLSGILSGTARASYCYQETANVSTVCGGLSGGYYSSTVYGGAGWSTAFPWDFTFDGDWDTYGQANITSAGSNVATLVTYQKPSNVSGNSIWRLEVDNVDENFTINPNCWNYNSSYLFFLIQSRYSVPETDSIPVCMGVSGYELLAGASLYGNNTIWEDAMNWSMPDGGYCSGTPDNCNTLNATACPTQTGCSMGGGSCSGSGSCGEFNGNQETCEGFGCSYSDPDCSGSYDCAVKGEQIGCELGSGCTWTPPSCIGNHAFCDYYGNETYCGSQLGCSWFDLTPPIIIIYSPQSTSYSITNITLNASADETIDTWWYSLNDGSNTTFIPNTTITAPQGSDVLVVYANDTAGNVGFSDFVFFFVDSIAPNITITSPQNITYNGVSQVSLNVSADEEINTWWYSINGGSNTTFTPNTTINIANGSNTVIVYANDTLGNIGQASVSFTGNYPCVTFLNSPADGNTTISSMPINMTFNCSAINDVSLANMTLYLNGVPNESRSVTGIYNFSIFTKTLGLGGYNWTCRACDYADQCSFGVPSRTFSIAAPTPSRPIDNLGLFGGIALLAIGAGILLLLVEVLFGSATEMLKDPKAFVALIVGVIIVVAVLTALL